MGGSSAGPCRTGTRYMRVEASCIRFGLLLAWPSVYSFKTTSFSAVVTERQRPQSSVCGVHVAMCLPRLLHCAFRIVFSLRIPHRMRHDMLHDVGGGFRVLSSLSLDPMTPLCLVAPPRQPPVVIRPHSPTSLSSTPPAPPSPSPPSRNFPSVLLDISVAPIPPPCPHAVKSSRFVPTHPKALDWQLTGLVHCRSLY